MTFPASPPTPMDDAETVEARHVELNLTLGLAGEAAGWEGYDGRGGSEP